LPFWVPQDKFKTISSIKKFKKILIRTIIAIIVFLLLLGIALSLPYVQTKIARYGTKYVNEHYGTNIKIDKIAISVFGTVKLKGVLILDHHKDTLIAATRLQTNILSFKNLANSNLQFSTLRAESLIFHLKTYKGEKITNLDKFVKAFDTGKPSTGKFRLKADNLYVSNGRFRLTNQNSVTPRVLDFKKLNGELGDFYIKGGDITANIKKLSLLDHRGLFVQNLKAAFTYTKTNIILDNLELATAESALRGAVKLTYIKEDFKDFVNRVNFDFRVDRATIASNELNYFYNEFGRNQKFYLSARLQGPLNNFVLQNLKLLDAQNSEIIGSINFRHLFDKKGPGFYMNGNFDRITSDYANLRSIMPRILGKSLPLILEKFGRINIVGDVMLTKKDIDAKVHMLSGLGEVQTDLSVRDFNNPNAAIYTGTIDLKSFSLGTLINNKTIGDVSLNLEVDGRGFNKQSLNATVKGAVTQLAFNNYNYRNITIDGRMKWPFFEGQLESNDPNLRLSFDGLVDMGKKRKTYDFHAQVDYANLKMLGLMKKDTISIFKGDLLFNANGSNLNDMAGTLEVKSLSYQNNKDTYLFDDFFVESVFDEENVRTITINSTDIVEGRVTGKYDTKELPKLIENALGSLYTNYKPNKVKPGQFMDFNFTIYNKIVEILLPDVIVGENTRVRGRINADKGEFQLGFNSPNIAAYNTYFDNINIDINNKNPLYNAYVQMDSIRMKNYKISDFNIINVTQNDTLYVRSEFKGGKEAKDFFNINLYHTIDKDNKSVVGLKKSEINFKNYLWYLNENDTRDNKVVFNKKLTDFAIDKISMSHNDQRMELSGILRGKDYKDIHLTFDDVQLEKVTPSLDSLRFGGRINGEVSLKQNKSEFEPASSLTIDSLSLNKYQLGNLDLNVTGDEQLRKFNVNTTLARDGDETFFTTGTVEIVNKQTTLDLDAGFTNFDISPLAVFLKSVFPEIRGLASGRARIVGNVKDPELDGRLYLKEAGLKVGYLNTNYDFEDDAVLDITEEQLFFRDMEIIDAKHKTKGRLGGSVKHKFFKDWALDLNIKSDRLLVLDTQDSDDAQFYGTAFIQGGASISGPVSGLLIKAEAKSVTGTNIKIPINNTGAVGASTYIHFLSPKEKENIGKGIVAETKTYNGLEMEFDLTITPDANIEIIIDKNTGHSLNAKGNGYLLLNINTLGKFNMWGDFQVQEGEYNFRYAGLIDKKFAVKKGGTINWEGDPTRARLNIEAIYRTQANPSVLLETPSFSRNIPVEVVITLNGTLLVPEPDFTINFPSVSSVLKSDLEYRLSDMDTRQTQALSLLSTGSFLSPTNANTAVYGSLFEKASSLLNDLFSDDESKLKVGLNYVQADKNPFVETNSQIGVTLSSQINDRITVNGQVGVPVGGVNESVIVGNVEVQLRINEDGTLKARVFNRENDINFLGEGINYTQGVGLTYEVDFDTFTEFINKVFRKAVIEKDTNANDEVPDSDFSPEYIKFMESRNKKKPEGEKEPQRIPETD
jgi:hypothetical protein